MSFAKFIRCDECDALMVQPEGAIEETIDGECIQLIQGDNHTFFRTTRKKKDHWAFKIDTESGLHFCPSCLALLLKRTIKILKALKGRFEIQCLSPKGATTKKKNPKGNRRFK